MAQHSQLLPCDGEGIWKKKPSLLISTCVTNPDYCSPHPEDASATTGNYLLMAANKKKPQTTCVTNPDYCCSPLLTGSDDHPLESPIATDEDEEDPSVATTTGNLLMAAILAIEEADDLFCMIQLPERRVTVSVPAFSRSPYLSLYLNLMCYKVVGAAKGLDFLHEREKPVIYRNFKASNILLDSTDYKAKLSDFGLAKDGPEGDETWMKMVDILEEPEKEPKNENGQQQHHGGQQNGHRRHRVRSLRSQTGYFIQRMLVLLLAGILFWGMSAHCALPPVTLHLERVHSTVGAELRVLQAKDQARHSFMGVVDFPVMGASRLDNVGLYFTRVKIGNPPKEFHLMIDTGSDITWINCISCTGCPSTSLLVQLSLFDPSSSSSAASVSCSDSMCMSGDAHSGCSSNSMCTYSFSYEDGTGTSGYYVSDVFSFDTLMAGSTMGISSASIIFGCSTYQSGDLTLPDSAIDGVLGFGSQRMSVISQLASHGHTPPVFSHCLRGDGGGVLVLGEIIEPGIIYSPLDPSRRNYNLYLHSISVSEQTVPVAPDVFARNGGTIVDSGTTLAYLAAEAYDPFVTALVAAIPSSVSSFPKEGSQCFLVSGSVGSRIRDVFPPVSLHFAGGASMVLKPEDYLLQRLDLVPGAWCIAFQRSQMTILGDLVLKDKIIVYDLAGQRLGWADYDCSSAVNVSLDSPAKHVSRASRVAPLFPIASVSLIVYIFFLV